MAQASKKPKAEPSESSRNPLTKDLFVGKPLTALKDYVQALRLKPNATWADVCNEQNRRYYDAVGQHLSPTRSAA